LILANRINGFVSFYRVRHAFSRNDCRNKYANIGPLKLLREKGFFPNVTRPRSGADLRAVWLAARGFPERGYSLLFLQPATSAALSFLSFAPFGRECACFSFKDELVRMCEGSIPFPPRPRKSPRLPSVHPSTSPRAPRRTDRPAAQIGSPSSACFAARHPIKPSSFFVSRFEKRPPMIFKAS